jgi:hypothetical protein
VTLLPGERERRRESLGSTSRKENKSYPACSYHYNTIIIFTVIFPNLCTARSLFPVR